MTSPLHAVEVHLLHQQMRQIASGICRLAESAKDAHPPMSQAELATGMEQLQLDLLRLKSALQELKSVSSSSATPSADGFFLPSILGGMALGVMLGKLVGSKLQLDLLPFLIGLDLVLGDSQGRFPAPVKS